MEKIALDNYNKMVIDNVKKLSKEEVQTLRKLGLSNEEIAKLEPEDNPFKDFALSNRRDISHLHTA